MGDDGDPLDVMALHDVPTFPGVVLLCDLIGVVRLTQKQKGKRIDNSRLIVLPRNSKRAHEVDDARDLPRELREELASFFLDVDSAEPWKAPRVEGWGGPKDAARLVTKGQAQFRKKTKKKG